MLMIDRKDEIFSATDETVDNDPARFLKRESLSRNPDAAESEPAKALKKDDFSERTEAGPTKALMLTKRPLMLEGCGHKGEVDVYSGEGKLSWKVEFAARCGPRSGLLLPPCLRFC